VVTFSCVRRCIWSRESLPLPNCITLPNLVFVCQGIWAWIEVTLGCQTAHCRDWRRCQSPTNLPSLLVLHQRERELEVGRNPFGYQEFKPLKLGSAVVAFPSVVVLLSEILWLCIKWLAHIEIHKMGAGWRCSQLLHTLPSHSWVGSPASTGVSVN